MTEITPVAGDTFPTKAEIRAAEKTERDAKNAKVLAEIHAVMAKRTEVRKAFRKGHAVHRGDMDAASRKIVDLCEVHDPPLASVPAPAQTGE